MRFAGAEAGRIAACTSSHGGGLFTDKPDRPHRAQPRIRFGHASQGPHMPAEAIEALDRAFRKLSDLFART